MDVNHTHIEAARAFFRHNDTKAGKPLCVCAKEMATIAYHLAMGSFWRRLGPRWRDQDKYHFIKMANVADMHMFKHHVEENF